MAATVTRGADRTAGGSPEEAGRTAAGAEAGSYQRAIGMRFAGVESAVACLQGHTEPQMPQKPPTLVCV
jgi:hypothetical protein